MKNTDKDFIQRMVWDAKEDILHARNVLSIYDNEPNQRVGNLLLEVTARCNRILKELEPKKKGKK